MIQEIVSFRPCFRAVDEKNILNFLFSLREEYQFADERTIQTLTDSIFEFGGFRAAFNSQGEMVALFGFFFGDPGDLFCDRKTAFFYLTAITRPYRMSGLFRNGMLELANTLKPMGIKTFKLKALKRDTYSTWLYSRVACAQSDSQMFGGQPAVLYAGSFEELILKAKRTIVFPTAL